VRICICRVCRLGEFIRVYNHELIRAHACTQELYRQYPRSDGGDAGVYNTYTLQHTATHCNTLQHTATHCNALQRTATHCNALQHTATHCTTLQHTATHCKSYTDNVRGLMVETQVCMMHTNCNTQQHTAIHCNTLQKSHR